MSNMKNRVLFLKRTKNHIATKALYPGCFLTFENYRPEGSPIALHLLDINPSITKDLMYNMNKTGLDVEVLSKHYGLPKWFFRTLVGLEDDASEQVLIAHYETLAMAVAELDDGADFDSIAIGVAKEFLSRLDIAPYGFGVIDQLIDLLDSISLNRKISPEAAKDISRVIRSVRKQAVEVRDYEDLRLLRTHRKRNIENGPLPKRWKPAAGYKIYTFVDVDEIKRKEAETNRQRLAELEWLEKNGADHDSQQNYDLAKRTIEVMAMVECLANVRSAEDVGGWFHRVFAEARLRAEYDGKPDIDDIVSFLAESMRQTSREKKNLEIRTKALEDLKKIGLEVT